MSSCADAFEAMTEYLSPIRTRDELRWIVARCDSGPYSDGIAAILKEIKTDIAWEQHLRSLRS